MRPILSTSPGHALLRTNLAFGTTRCGKIIVPRGRFLTEGCHRHARTSSVGRSCNIFTMGAYRPSPSLRGTLCICMDGDGGRENRGGEIVEVDVLHGDAVSARLRAWLDGAMCDTISESSLFVCTNLLISQ
jgi:hypothetical protein